MSEVTRAIEVLRDARQIAEDRMHWLEWRRAGIGSSDAAGIAGISPWSSPLSVWLDKVGLGTDSAPNEAMRWGTLLEPLIISEFEDRTGYWISHRQSPLILDGTVMRATIDGLVSPGGRQTPAAAVYEGKTAGDWGRAAWDEGVPDHYQLQVQHQMAITGMKAAWVVALIGGQRLTSFLIERDQEAIDMLFDLEDTFWRKYVLTQTPPPIDGSERTTEAIRDAFSEPSADVVELPAVALDLVRQIHAAAAEEKLAQERAEAARNTLRMLLGEAEVGMYGGWPLATWKRIEQDRIDVEELRAREPSIAARYSKPTSYRRLHLPKHKEVTT